jgi:hypothetical protein
MANFWGLQMLTRFLVIVGVVLLCAVNQEARSADTQTPASYEATFVAGDNPRPETKISLTKDVSLEFTLQKPGGNFLWGLDLVHGDRESFLYNNLYDDLRTDQTCTYYFDRSTAILWIGTLESIKKCTWEYDPLKDAMLPSIVKVGAASQLEALIKGNVLPPEFAKHMQRIVAFSGAK